jgi:hypothetical protein
MITYIKKNRRKRAEKYTDVETGAKQKKSWKFWSQKRQSQPHDGFVGSELPTDQVAGQHVNAQPAQTNAMEMHAVELSGDNAKRMR